jgi:PIN domain nuclease of toxin-antitoxin system
MILLDTHAVLWLAAFAEKLSPAATDAIREARLAGDPIALSSQSFYELAWGISRGRIEIDEPVESFFEQIESRFVVLPLTSRIARIAAELSASLSGDPFDRIIAATALTEGIPLVTADERIRRAGIVKTIW